MKNIINIYLETYVEDTEYILNYNNVVRTLDMLNVEYDIADVDELNSDDMRAASHKCNVLVEMVSNI